MFTNMLMVIHEFDRTTQMGEENNQTPIRSGPLSIRLPFSRAARPMENLAC